MTALTMSMSMPEEGYLFIEGASAFVAYRNFVGFCDQKNDAGYPFLLQRSEAVFIESRPSHLLSKM